MAVAMSKAVRGALTQVKSYPDMGLGTSRLSSPRLLPALLGLIDVSCGTLRAVTLTLEANPSHLETVRLPWSQEPPGQCVQAAGSCLFDTALRCLTNPLL